MADTSNTKMTYDKNPFFDSFFSHPFIQTLTAKKQWSISDNKKRPIDLVEYQTTGRIIGAIYSNEKSLVDLMTLNKILPNAANYAFYLDAFIDKFVVLDIEPTCPENVKNQFMRMQPLYSEVSMSGKGIHMVFPFPEHIMQKYPDAQNKIVFRGENHEYEILINHYVTFTGRQIAIPKTEHPLSFEDLFEKLAAHQKPTATATDIEINEMEPVETKELPKLIALLRAAMNRYSKTPDDFKKDNGVENDTSRYEYAVIGYMYTNLKQILKVQSIAKEHTYTLEEQIWIMYQIIYDYIPKRAKHNELRGGRPYIVFLMESVIAKYTE